ncbi:MAG: hypothetical protein Q7T57_00400 [Dehalococcoidales bacterium]|nr:hypothetical protein [Dehalococcoidales bacterium]
MQKKGRGGGFRPNLFVLLQMSLGSPLLLGYEIILERDCRYHDVIARIISCSTAEVMYQCSSAIIGA